MHECSSVKFRRKRRPPNLQAKAEKANEKHGEISQEVVAAIGDGAAESKSSKRTPTAGKKGSAPAAAEGKKSAPATEEKKKKCIIS